MEKIEVVVMVRADKLAAWLEAMHFMQMADRSLVERVVSGKLEEFVKLTFGRF
jgi:hypothetical protein